MKQIVKTIFFMAIIAILPTLSEAQTDYKQWMELAEQGYITKEEAATAIEKMELERTENSRLAMEQNHEKDMRQAAIIHSEKICRAIIPIVAIIAITGGIVLVSMFAFRILRRKDEQKKEMFNKLIDKGVFTQGEPVNLELFNAQTSVITSKNFITDATIAGIGYGFISICTAWADIILAFANILFWVGILRLTVRTAIAIVKFVKDKKVNKKVENSSTESAVAPSSAAKETNK